MAGWLALNEPTGVEGVVTMPSIVFPEANGVADWLGQDAPTDAADGLTKRSLGLPEANGVVGCIKGWLPLTAPSARNVSTSVAQGLTGQSPGLQSRIFAARLVRTVSGQVSGCLSATGS